MTIAPSGIREWERRQELSAWVVDCQIGSSDGWRSCLYRRCQCGMPCGRQCQYHASPSVKWVRPLTSSPAGSSASPLASASDNNTHKCVTNLFYVDISWPYCFMQCLSAFSALTLLVGCQKEHQACKNEWWGAGMSKVQMICIWSIWFHCHPGDGSGIRWTIYPIISCIIKIQDGLSFWCRLTHIVLEKGH